MELTYIKQGSEPVGDAGDSHSEYDRFGQTVDMRWQMYMDLNGQSLEVQYGSADSMDDHFNRITTPHCFCFLALVAILVAGCGPISPQKNLPAIQRAEVGIPLKNISNERIITNRDRLPPPGIIADETFVLAFEKTTPLHTIGDLLVQIPRDYGVSQVYFLVEWPDKTLGCLPISFPSKPFPVKFIEVLIKREEFYANGTLAAPPLSESISKHHASDKVAIMISCDGECNLQQLVTALEECYSVSTADVYLSFLRAP